MLGIVIRVGAVSAIPSETGMISEESMIDYPQMAWVASGNWILKEVLVFLTSTSSVISA